MRFLRLTAFLLTLLTCVSACVAGELRWCPWTLNPHLASATPYALGTSGPGEIFIGTNNGLWISDGSALRHIPLTDSYGNTSVTVKEINRGDTSGLLRVTTLSGLYTLDRSGRAVRIADVDRDSVNRRSYTDPLGHIWSYDQRTPGLRCVYRGESIAVPADLRGKIITDMVSIADFGIAIATNNDGVYIYSPFTGRLTNYRRTLTDSSPLPGNHITALAYDSAARRLYAAIPHAGLYTADIPATAPEIVETGIPEEISSIRIDRAGRLWTSYDGAGIHIAVPGADDGIHLTVATAGLPSDVVTNISPLRGDTMLAATYGAGIFSVTPRGEVTPVPGLGSNSPAAHSRSMAFDSLGNLWIASFASGVVRRGTDGTIKNFRTFNSALGTDYITDIAASPSGDSIFIATGYGLYAFDAATLNSTHIALPAAPPANGRLSIRQLSFSSDGRMWLATPSGLCDRNGAVRLLPDKSLKAIAKGHDGNIMWVTTDSAVYKIDVGAPVLRAEAYDEFRDLRFSYYALSVDSAGYVRAGSFGALAVIPPDSTATASPAPARRRSVRWWWLLGGLPLCVAAGALALQRRSKPPETVAVKAASDEPHPDDPRHEIPAPAAVAVTPMPSPDDVDRSWLASMDRIIDDNLANPDFTIEDFSQAAGMSRSNLYKRISAITGKSPLEYLRDRRVERGHEILTHNSGRHVRITISEVAFKVGMSPRQFSKYHRERYPET